MSESLSAGNQEIRPDPVPLIDLVAQHQEIESQVAAAVSDARAWFAAHAKLRVLDDNGQHQAAVASALGAASGDVGASFTRLSNDLTTAIISDQDVFNSTAPSASSAYTGLEAGEIVLSLLMAAACAWGLGRRLAEYR